MKKKKTIVNKHRRIKKKTTKKWGAPRQMFFRFLQLCSTIPLKLYPFLNMIPSEYEPKAH